MIDILLNEKLCYGLFGYAFAMGTNNVLKDLERKGLLTIKINNVGKAIILVDILVGTYQLYEGIKWSKRNYDFCKEHNLL